jgi:hypothetical protein
MIKGYKRDIIVCQRGDKGYGISQKSLYRLGLSFKIIILMIGYTKSVLLSEKNSMNRYKKPISIPAPKMAKTW